MSRSCSFSAELLLLCAQLLFLSAQITSVISICTHLSLVGHLLYVLFACLDFHLNLCYLRVEHLMIHGQETRWTQIFWPNPTRVPAPETAETTGRRRPTAAAPKSKSLPHRDMQQMQSKASTVFLSVPEQFPIGYTTVTGGFMRPDCRIYVPMRMCLVRTRDVVWLRSRSTEYE